jgi:hypothetical protein
MRFSLNGLFALQGDPVLEMNRLHLKITFTLWIDRISSNIEGNGGKMGARAIQQCIGGVRVHLDFKRKARDYIYTFGTYIMI